ncbi:MAG: heavy metal translocating P-type ATPase [Isosphaeraceae bacterium]
MSRPGQEHEAEALCDHCGLPLPRAWWGRREPAEGPEYCCLGCRLAAAVVQERGAEGSARGTLVRLGLSGFFTMNVMAFTMALWTADVYRVEAGESARLVATFESLFRLLVFFFAAPVLVLLGWPLWRNAVEGVRRGVFSTDLLLASGVAASFAYSAASVWRGSGPVYFEVGCVVLVMVTLGRWLEATGKLKASTALDGLARLLPERVLRVRDGGEESVPLAEVAPGDLLRVRAGERIPADGVVRGGSAFVNEQVITGESAPRPRHAGDPVLGGTLDLDGDLLVEVAAAGPAGTLARMIELVRQARQAKGRYERLADRVSSWFVPAVTLVALCTFAYHGFYSGWERGLLQGLAVVLIACPCALGLATPLAVWSALGRAAGSQVLFRSGEALERLAAVRAVRFDKTGTLTTGEPRVAGLDCENPTGAAEAERRAGLLASSSTHVLSRAVLGFAGPVAPGGAGAEVRSLAGRGVSAVVEGSETYLGSRRLMDEQGLAVGPTLEAAARGAEAAGRSLCWVGWDGAARGLFTFDEHLRDSAAEAVARCRALGIDVGVLTGDHDARGAALAAELGVHVEAGLLPEDKVAAIDAARSAHGAVAMVGDGVNDAPALAASDLGVALGCGADLSRESAAVCLLGDDLDRFPWAVELARRTVGVIRGNLAWAFGYNAVGVAAAAAGWLNPAFAAFLMVGSSAFVILNTLRLNGGDSAEPEHVIEPAREPGAAAWRKGPRDDRTGPDRARRRARLGALRRDVRRVCPHGRPGRKRRSVEPRTAARLLGGSNFHLRIPRGVGRLRRLLVRAAVDRTGPRTVGPLDRRGRGAGGAGAGDARLGAEARPGLRGPQDFPAPCLAGSFVGPFFTSPRCRDVFLAGVLNGLLPCGLVYGYLALASSTASLPWGVATMTAFGLGTVPLMVVTGLGASALAPLTRRRVFRFAGACVLVTGILAVDRGVRFWHSGDPASCPGCHPSASGPLSAARRISFNRYSLVPTGDRGNEL